MTEAKRGGRRLLSESGSTGGHCTGAEEELVKTNESGTSGVSSVRGEDEFNRPTPLDEKTAGPVPSQGDSGAMLGAQRNGKRVGA